MTAPPRPPERPPERPPVPTPTPELAIQLDGLAAALVDLLAEHWQREHPEPPATLTEEVA